MQTSTLSKAQLCSVVFAKSFFSVMPSETGWNQEPAAGTTCQCPCPFHPIKTGAWRTCGHVRSKWRSGVARLIRSLSLRLPQGMASQMCASGFPSASYSGSSRESVSYNSLLPRNRFENSAQVRQKFFQNAMHPAAAREPRTFADAGIGAVDVSVAVAVAIAVAIAIAIAVQRRQWSQQG